MSTDPTPAPALTAEQIDADLDDLRDLVANFGPCDRKNRRSDLFDRTIAAVVARAKREERHVIITWLNEFASDEGDPATRAAFEYAAELLTLAELQ